MMAKIKARATLLEYSTLDGRRTSKSQRVYAMLCTSEKPEIFDIVLPDSRITRGRSIHITRSEIERVLEANARK